MKLKITYYLDVASSWCFLAEPAWAALRDRYAGRVDFEWKIALMDAAGLPTSQDQLAWFYRRSGTIMRSPFMLQTGWLQPGATEYRVRNCVAEAARELGVTDDRVRLALATVVLRDGKQADQWDRAVEIGAEAGGVDRGKLLERARAPDTEARVRASTEEFHALRVTQRPTFVIDSEIGDRAVFSGFAKLPPLVATVDAMLEDIADMKAMPRILACRLPISLGGLTLSSPGNPMKTYMVIESFYPGCKEKIYERFDKKGRMLPDGLAYVNSWLEKDGDRCFQLMETEDASLFQVWFEQWEDLLKIEVIELGEKPKAQGTS